jgi:hypothetical protein
MARMSQKPNYVKVHEKRRDGPMFALLPLRLMESKAYLTLRGSELRLLLEFLRLLKPDKSNNGDLSASPVFLVEHRGWASKSTAELALKGLVRARILHETRRGGFPHRLSTFALTSFTLPRRDDYDLGAYESFTLGAYRVPEDDAKTEAKTRGAMLDALGQASQARQAAESAREAMKRKPSGCFAKNQNRPPKIGSMTPENRGPLDPKIGGLPSAIDPKIGPIGLSEAPENRGHLKNFCHLSGAGHGAAVVGATAASPGHQAQPDAARQPQPAQPAVGDRGHDAGEQKKIGSPKFLADPAVGAGAAQSAADGAATDGPRKFRPRGWWTPDRIAELRAFRAVHSIKETAARFGLTKQRQYEILGLPGKRLPADAGSSPPAAPSP